MMKWMNYALLLSVTVYLTACENDFELVADWKEIPVVYGVFNLEDTVHYVSVQKVFLDPDESAFAVAQRSDSLYFEDIDVYLIEREDTLGKLTKVDVNTLSGDFTREDGIFASDVNYAYEYRGQIRQRRPYTLFIRNNKSGKTYSSTMNAVGINVTPDQFITAPSSSVNASMRWSYDPNRQENFRWSEAINASIYDLTVRLNYQEYEVDINSPGQPEVPGTRKDLFLDWKLQRNILSIGTGAIRVEANGQSFFEFVGRELDAPAANIRRCAGRIDVRVTAGGSEIRDYLTSQSINSGLVGSTVPADIYSNIENGYGVFSSYLPIEETGFRMDGLVHDSLATGVFTRGLAFTGTACN